MGTSTAQNPLQQLLLKGTNQAGEKSSLYALFKQRLSCMLSVLFTGFFLRLTDRTIGESLKKTMTVSLSSPTWSLAFCLLLEITSHSVSVLWFINKYSGARGSLLHLYHLCKAVQSVSLSYKWVILTYVGLTLRSSFYLKISWCYRQNAKWFDYLHCSPLPLSSVNKAKRRLCKAKPEETVTK